MSALGHLKLSGCVLGSIGTTQICSEIASGLERTDCVGDVHSRLENYPAALTSTQYRSIPLIRQLGPICLPMRDQKETEDKEVGGGAEQDEEIVAR